jgi:aryl-alcohol dehydrogenase-like predicted oxidoreductase
MAHDDSRFSRRRLLQLAAAACAGALAADARAADAAEQPLITKAIPSTGEKLPVIGIGTNSFREASYADLRALLQRMQALGGTVIDTAPSYGESEGVIGRALAESALRDRAFLSTKLNARGKGWGPQDNVTDAASVDQSLQRLKTQKIDLLEVHRVAGLDDLMPLLQQYKKEGKIRYLGVTTFQNSEHAQMAEAIRKHSLDFVQLDYSLGNRNAANTLLPLAAERKVAVMIDVPLGGGRSSLISEAAGRQLPKWAADFGAASWSQFFLKYVVSHPAVTCAIPGATKIEHMEDNQGAGRGRLPDARERKRMEEFWDGKGA